MQIPVQTRPLPPPKPYTSKTQRLKVGHASDMGKVRTTNQDAVLILLSAAEMVGTPPTMGLFVVADGMGGHTHGERASALAAQTIARYVADEIYVPALESHEPGADQRTIPEVLTEAMEAANAAVHAEVPDGGTTVTCAFIRADLVHIAHVGDSRAYLVSEDRLELITRDHSLVRRLQELGQLTPEEAEQHPQRNVLYRAIGQGDTLEVDAATRRLPPSSCLLLCSDGLWGVVAEDDLLNIVRSTPDPQEACEELIKAALAGGGPDNISVVLVHMPD
jgi:serine/threonine protein phosphatase PrpC